MIRINVSALALLLLLFPLSVHAVDITDNLSVSGTATTVYQWLNLTKGYTDEENGTKKKDRGSAVIDFNVSFKPYEQGELFLRASFAKGDGLKAVSPFVLSPNADDLLHDLKNINGHSRDHLLELWYAHKFELQKEMSLRIQGGIIDSTAFIDDNAYANSEIQQFMNSALVNNPIANRPTYDAGAVIEFEWDKFHLRVLGMRSKNDIERKFNIAVVQAGYKLDTELGEGNYRIYAYTTDRKFPDWDGDVNKALKGVGVSFDQQLIKDTLGAFFRAGWQDDSVKTDYHRMFSFGMNLNGIIWGRKGDEIGLGYAYLKSPSKNEELKHSQVFESYIKFRLFCYKTLSSDITFDYQYIRDRARESRDTKAGNVYGIRLNFSF
ncbi:carbohydrate porin [Thermodesulfovibrio sp.]|uniref:carbohydrate porin n=1 Tax=Thermodesulfovibrio sp. TaxID=2067987 RepID=UPI0030B79FF8